MFPFCFTVMPDQANALKSRVLKLILGVSSGGNTLPGPLPHTLTRMHLDRIRNNEYWVCEKSDGLRTMFYVEDSGAYLIDRKFGFHRVDDPTNLLPKLLTRERAADEPPGTPYETLVDGELISVAEITGESERINKNVPPSQWRTEHLLVVFDTIVVRGESVKQLDLLERLKRVQHLTRPIRNLKAKGINPPIRIESKRFSTSVQDIVGRIRCEGGDWIYTDIDKGFKSLNDGIILTPKYNNYMHDKDPNLPILKFKWPGLHTVDFLLVPPFVTARPTTLDPNERLELQLYTSSIPAPMPSTSGYGNPSGTRGSKPIHVLCRFTPILGSELRDLEAQAEGKPVVAEMYYDMREGRWRIKHLRKDKDSPNFVNTVFSCMEAMAEGITISELSKIVTPPSASSGSGAQSGAAAAAAGTMNSSQPKPLPSASSTTQ